MIVRTYLNIPDSEARMMEARTQTGRGSNSGPRERMTASSARLDTRPVSRDLQPDLSCTRDLESEADMGRQRRNEPTMLLTPWATHSGLGGTLYPCLEPNIEPSPRLMTMLTTAIGTLGPRTRGTSLSWDMLGEGSPAIKSLLSSHLHEVTVALAVMLPVGIFPMSLIVLTLNSSLRPRKYEMVVRTAMRTSWVGSGKLQNFLALTERIESQKTRKVMQAQEMASVIRFVFTIFSPEINVITLVAHQSEGDNTESEVGHYDPARTRGTGNFIQAQNVSITNILQMSEIQTRLLPYL